MDALLSPPAIPGLPIVGNVVEYLRDPVALLRSGYERHGRVFGISLGPRRAAVLLGSENNRFFFRETGASLDMASQHRWVVPMFGPLFPLAASAADYHSYREVYASPFHPARMSAHLDRMTTEVDLWLDGLNEQGELELVRETSRLTVRGAARAILGDELRERLGPDLERLFARLIRCSKYHLLRNMQIPCPGRSSARKALRESVLQEICRRESGDSGEPDFLTAFLDAQTAEGRGVSESDATDLALGMVWATFPTSSAHLAWALVHLLQHPAALARVVAEIDAVAARGEAPGPARLLGLEFLDQALRETERLRPAVLLLGRLTVRAYEREGFRVPAGWVTLVSPALSHRLPEEYANPDRYDPERFAPGRPNGRRQSASLIGFGGGVHACLGKQFAYAWLKITVGRLLKRYDLELLTRDVRPAAGLNPSGPAAPVRVAYARRGGGDG